MRSSRPTGSKRPDDIAWGSDLQTLGVPKHKRLELALERKIRTGAFSAGQKLPTEIELMQQTRLSYATVSRALRSLADAGLVRRKRGCGTFVVGPASGAAGTEAGTTAAAETLAHFHGGIKIGFHPYFSLLLEGLIAAAGKHGMSMKFIAAPEGSLGIAEGFLKRNGIAGFTTSQAKRSELEAALAAHLPMVVLSGSHKDLPLDRVEADADLGTRLAFRHLKNLGHKRIAVIDTRRKENVEEAAAEVFDCLVEDAPIDPLYVGNWDMAAGIKAAAGWKALAARPTAAYVGDDFLLMNFLRVLQQDGIRVPQDLAVVGRGSPASAAFIGMPVTMVESDPAELADEAIELLLAQIQGTAASGRSVLIPPRLVVR
jgi:LacI family transcriptional regulator